MTLLISVDDIKYGIYIYIYIYKRYIHDMHAEVVIKIQLIVFIKMFKYSLLDIFQSFMWSCLTEASVTDQKKP